MRKLLNNPWFVTAMSLLAVALAWSSLRSPDTSGEGQIAAESTEPTDSAIEQPLPGGALGTVSPIDALKKLPAPKPARDPFASRTQQAVAAEVVEQPDLVDTARLTGVWTQNGATLLLVNDRVAQVGDTIGRLTIESANQDGIWLAHWKGRDWVPVGQTFSLKTPARLAAQASTP